MRWNGAIGAAVVVLGLAPGALRAQFPYQGGGVYGQRGPVYVSPFARPPVSPYVNLLRPGSSPAVNYYGLVRPQQQFRAGLQNLGQQQAATQQNVSSLAGGLPITGNRAQFLTQSRYFLNNHLPGEGGGLGSGLSHQPNAQALGSAQGLGAGRLGGAGGGRSSAGGGSPFSGGVRR